jgi:hypothetical protein
VPTAAIAVANTTTVTPLIRRIRGVQYGESIVRG